MGALSQVMGVLRPAGERRSGRDRRRFIDPRYRNAAFPEYVDRRSGERRRPVYEEVHPFVKEHPFRRWIVIISVLVAAFLGYMFFFSSFMASRKGPEERRPKGTITLGHSTSGNHDGWAKKKC